MSYVEILVKGDVRFTAAFGLHELYSQSEQAAGLVSYHLQVIVFAGACQGISPEEIHALSSVQVAQFFGVDFDGSRIVEFEQLLQCLEVDIIGRVDCLSCAEDTMRDRDSTSKEGGVFYVVDATLTESQK